MKEKILFICILLIILVGCALRSKNTKSHNIPSSSSATSSLSPSSAFPEQNDNLIDAKIETDDPLMVPINRYIVAYLNAHTGRYDDMAEVLSGSESARQIQQFLRYTAFSFETAFSYTVPLYKIDSEMTAKTVDGNKATVEFFADVLIGSHTGGYSRLGLNYQASLVEKNGIWYLDALDILDEGKLDEIARFTALLEKTKKLYLDYQNADVEELTDLLITHFEVIVKDS